MDMPLVALAAAAEYTDEAIDRALARVLDPLGGLAPLLAGRETVLLKPNFLVARTPEAAITTHPRVIAAMARAVRAVHDGRLLVGDGPAVGSSTSVARRLGLPEMLTGLDVEIVDFAETVTVPSSDEDAGFGSFQMARPLVEADAVINLPKVKTHGQMFYTGAVKNTFGAFVGFDKPRLHLTAGRDWPTFARMLLEVSRRVNPVLSIVDGVVGMEGNGPSNGTPRPLGLLIGGHSPVAVDRVIVDLLGFDPAVIPVLAEARVQGLPGMDLDGISLLGDPPERFRVTDWEPAAEQSTVETVGFPQFMAGTLRWLMATYPRFDPSKCTRCKLCAKHCAAEALQLEKRGLRSAGPKQSDRHMAVDLDKCIRCYCCQEVCPEGAITVGQGLFLRTMRRAERVLGLFGKRRELT